MKEILVYIKKHKIKITVIAEEMRCSINHLSCVLHDKHKPSHSFQTLLFNTLLMLMHSRWALKSMESECIRVDQRELQEIIKEKKNERGK